MATLYMRLSVTIAFVLGAAAVAAALWVGVDLGLVPQGTSVDADWFAQGFALVSFAAFAGLMVDALRLMAALFWHKKPRYRLKLKKILRKNLA